jgi:predicted short-subunit dehydrogenase-like oxidoreductase (DUF2520 family)
MLPDPGGPLRIAIVGPGRLGRSLALLAARVGHETSLHGRGEPVPAAELTLLTVPDRAISEVAATIPRDRVVAHTSGASGLDVLGERPLRGSLHPLMTFPGPELELPDLHGVPFAIDGATPEVIATLEQLALDLGGRPVRVPGDRRLYHAAAVIAGNFATVLLADAAEVLAAAGVPPDQGRAMLAPLMHASIAHAVVDPVKSLTGPIVRGDRAILSEHRRALLEHGMQDVGSIHSLLEARAARQLAASRLDTSGREDDVR